MNIGRFVLVLIFLLTVVGTVAAATYEMFLNKDDKLCREAFQLVNEDLKQHGEVQYDRHEMFKTIEWQPLAQTLGSKFKDEPCSVSQLAKFDINNDGRQDMVVKLTGCFHSRPTDSIYFLDPENPALSSYGGFSDIIENSIGRFPADSSVLAVYNIKQLQPVKTTKASKVYHGVAGWLVINPFIYQGISYLAIADNTKESFLIGKYKSPEELDEGCYFESKTSKSSKSPSKKKDRS